MHALIALCLLGSPILIFMRTIFKKMYRYIYIIACLMATSQQIRVEMNLVIFVKDIFGTSDFLRSTVDILKKMCDTNHFGLFYFNLGLKNNL